MKIINKFLKKRGLNGNGNGRNPLRDQNADGTFVVNKPDKPKPDKPE